MINGVTTVAPAVEVYHTQCETKQFVEEYWEESQRTWSYLPFYHASSNKLEYCDSHFSPLGPALAAHTHRLDHIKEGFYVLNESVEQCLNRHSLYYTYWYNSDSGPQIVYLAGDQFSMEITPPSNDYATAVMMALSDVSVRLEKHDIEFHVSSGDVLVMPCLFPYDLRIKPEQDKKAFLLFKYMWPR